MLLRVLGPLEVDGADGPAPVGGPVPRRVLCALLAHAGAVVPLDALVAAAWGEDRPASAERSLQSHLVRLRDALLVADPSGALMIERGEGGYRVVVDPALVDSGRLEQAVAEAPELPGTEAVTLLRAALALWRQPAPYADLFDTVYPAADAARLTELRGKAVELLVAALLEVDPAGAAAAAEVAVRDEPYREHLWELLILALYRQGRQGDALAAYQRARAMLDEGLGVEPGPRLRELEGQVLAQDPSLLAPVRDRRRPCPYKGLARYDTDDAALYVGREHLVDELVARLVDTRFLVVVGPSGAGKSSLVRAGLVPALEGGSLPGSHAWTVRVVMPGADPVPVLRRAFEGAPDVVVVDQAEEALLAGDGAFIEEIGDQVLAAVGSGARVVLVVRADFYGRLAEHPALARRAGPATLLVGPPDDVDLRRIVVEPAERVGLRVDPALADLVVAEVRGRPGALPVLSTALVRTWEHRVGDTLTVASYREGGGVAAALQRVGEEAWAALDDEQRVACRRLLLRLATDEDGSWVRRRARRSEVAPPSDVAASGALDVLTNRRLVVVHADDVEIAHESLLTGWPRLNAWLEDGRALAGVLDHLAVSASAWELAGRDTAELYRGTRLQSALDTASANPDDIGTIERAFLNVSSDEAERELDEQRSRADREERGRRRTRAVAAGLATALGLAALAGGFAIHQQRQAESIARAADAQRLGALARTGGDYDLALLYAAQAVKLDPSPATESDLFAVLERGDAVTSVARTPGLVTDMTFSRDGRSVVLVTGDGQLVSYAADGGAATSDVDLDSSGFPRTVSALPDGSVLAGTATGPHVVNPTTGAVSQRGPGGGALASVSPDGKTAIVGVQQGGVFGPAILVWHLGSLAASAQRVELGAPPVAATGCGADTCLLLTDGMLVRVAFADGAVVSRVRIASTPLPNRMVASADGARLAYWSRDGLLHVLDPRNGTAVATLPGGSRDPQPLAFSPDGSLLASRDFDDVLLWHLEAPSLPERLPGHSGRVVAAAFSPDGSALATASDDRTLISWDLAGHGRLGAIATRALASNPTTLWASTTSGFAGVDGAKLSFVDLASGGITTVSETSHPGADAVLESVRAGVDGGPVVTADSAGAVELWDPATQRSLGGIALPAAGDAYGTTTWVSPEGMRAATVRNGLGPLVIDLATRAVHQLTPLPSPEARYTEVQGWSPDGRELYLTRVFDGSNDLLAIDSSTGVVRLRVTVQGQQPNEVAPDPKGRFLAVGMSDGSMRFLDPTNGQQIAPPTSTGGSIYNVSVSPDGRYVAATGDQSLVWVWDTRTYRLVGDPFTLDVGAPDARARFTPDGRLVVTSGRVLRVLTLDPTAWVARACHEAGRALTQDEWNELLPERTYDPACAPRRP